MEANTISIENMLESAEKPALKKQEIVDFLVEYPKDYAGPKHMADGSTHAVAKDAGEYFESLGIGKIQGEHDPKLEKPLTEQPKPFKESRTSKVTVELDDKKNQK